MPLVTAVIKKCRKKDYDPKRPKSKQRWCLYDHEGKKLLGRHPSKKRALRQERAIQVRKHGRVMKYAYVLRRADPRPTSHLYEKFQKLKEMQREKAKKRVPYEREISEKKPQQIEQEDKRSRLESKKELYRALQHARERHLLPPFDSHVVSPSFQKSLLDRSWHGYDYALRRLTDDQRAKINSFKWFRLPGWRFVYEILNFYKGNADAALDRFTKFFDGGFNDDPEAWAIFHDFYGRIQRERATLQEYYPDISIDEMVEAASGELDEATRREIEKIRKRAPKPLKRKDISEKALTNYWKLQQKKKKEKLQQWKRKKPLTRPTREKQKAEEPAPVPADRLPAAQRALLSRVQPRELTAKEEVAFEDAYRLRRLLERLRFLEDALKFDHYFQKKTLELDDVEFALPYLRALSEEAKKLPATAHVVKFKGAYYQPLGSIPFYPFEETTQRMEMSTEKNPEMIRYAGHVYVLAAEDEEPTELEMEGDISDEHLEEEQEEMDLLEDLKKHWKVILDKMPDDMPVDDDFEVALDGIEKVISEMESLHDEYEASMKDMEEAEEPEKEEDEDED